MDAIEMALGAFAVVRAVIGLAPLVAARPVSRALGFPKAEDTASARVFARLFGVRDIGLGAMIAWSIPRPELWIPLIVLNALTDAGDLGAFAAGMRGRPDLRRALGPCAAVAGAAVVAWTVLGLVILGR